MTVDLEALVRACAAAGPVEIGVEVAGEFGAVLGDPGLLRRVFGNLLQNAADAARETGRPVSVRIVGRRAASGRHWLVEVDDDGPGIPADRREQIFTPFVTTRARGTGLGLAFVQRTLDDMGGSVEAADGSRGGACFRLRLPVATPEGSLVPSRNVTVAPASRRSLDGIDAIPKT